jgi:hypothetical protein
MTSPTPIRRAVEETRHVVRNRRFTVNDDSLARAAERLLGTILDGSSFTGTITLHVFRGVATAICAEDRASVDPNSSGKPLTHKG